MINIQQIVYLLKTRKERLGGINSTYGSMVKEYRLKNDLTLEDVAEEVCSVSYISKIENNLIKPSERFMKLLEEKHNIFKEQKTTDETLILNNIFEAIKNDNLDFIKNLDYPKNNSDYRKKLLTLFKSAVDLNEQIFKHYLTECMLYIQSYTEKEVAIFIYILITYYFNNEKHLKVYEMKTLIDEIKCYEIKLRLKYYYFISAWYLGYGVDSSELLEVKTFFIHNLENEKVIHLTKNEFYKKIFIMKFNKIEEEIDKNNLKEDDKNYFLAIVYLQEKKYLEALELVNKIENLDEDVIVLKNILLYKTGKYVKNNNNFSKLSSEIVSRFIDNTFLDRKDFINEIKNYSNVIINEIDIFYLLEFLMLESVEILRLESFYKDALNILIKYNYVLRERIAKI